MNCNGNTDTTFHFDSSIEEALSFLDELQKLNSESNYPQRGVYLARLELYSRLKENAFNYIGKINLILNLIIQLLINILFDSFQCFEYKYFLNANLFKFYISIYLLL